MKRNSFRIGFLFAILMLINSFMVVNTTSVTASVQQTEIIYIAVAPGIKYNVSEIALATNTQYNITFINAQANENHNLVISKPDILNTEGTIIDNKDVQLGPDPTDFNQPGIEGGRVWSTLWTTPAEDSWVQFGCSFVGHFATMNGWFKVGDPGNKPTAASPGFELIIGLIAVLGLAIYRIRRK